jgi:hypothetical protein
MLTERGVGRTLALPLLALAVAVVLSCAPSARASGPPSIGSVWGTDVSANGAVLHAEINPEGSSTNYRFEYLTDAEFEANIAAGHDPYLGARAVPPTNTGLGAGSDFQPVSFALTPPANPLIPDTGYRYRALATSSVTTTGQTRLLHTKSISPPSGLPDHRAWELVSPIEKGGGQIAAPQGVFGGGQFQAAVAGGALSYSSATAFAGPLGAPPASQYTARRSASGWSGESTSPPLLSGVYGDHPDGAPYRIFSPSLAVGLLDGGDPCRGLETCPDPAPPLSISAPGAYRTYYFRQPDGTYDSLLDSSDLAHSALEPAQFHLSLAGATTDLSAVVLSTCAALTADATEKPAPDGCIGQNLYEWRDGNLTALNIPPGEPSTIPGAELAAPLGAISADGSRVYWRDLASGDLWLSEAGHPPRPLPLGIGAEFQGASDDGSLAYFARANRLYRYSVSSETSALLADEVGGVLAISPDGAYVYYVDAAGLQFWNAGAVREIASGPEIATSSDYPPASATVRLSADGTRLAFLSAAALGGFDNVDAESGQPDTQVYLYDATTGALICVSCNPTGERPEGSASIPGALINGTTAIYRPRALSSDGRRLFFESTDDLLTGDTDSALDVYEWEASGEGSCSQQPGCLRLLSGGRQAGGRFLDASADGADVFFLTADSLVRSDPGSIDVYDARVDGGLPEPTEPIPCTGDACQPLPSPPEDPNPGTTIPNSGNPAVKYFKEHEKRHHRKHKKKHQHRKHAHHRGGR